MCIFLHSGRKLTRLFGQYFIHHAKNIAYLLGIKGGIHIIDYHKIEQDEEYLLYAVSDVLLNAKKGFLKEQL